MHGVKEEGWYGCQKGAFLCLQCTTVVVSTWINVSRKTLKIKQKVIDWEWWPKQMIYPYFVAIVNVYAKPD